MVAIDIQKPSVALSRVADSETHGEDSPYFAGWKAYDENPYDELLNPTGVIQMGLAENQVSFQKGENLYRTFFFLSHFLRKIKNVMKCCFHAPFQLFRNLQTVFNFFLFSKTKIILFES